MPINETYRTWIRRICELRPEQRNYASEEFCLADGRHFS